MIAYDPTRARLAVQYLVDSSYYHLHVKKLRNTVVRPRSFPFREEAEALNELLVIGRQNVTAMENLISVAELKRGSKNDYQREYMAAKRRRDRKVVQLEELMAGGRLVELDRYYAVRNQYVVWNRERDKFVAKRGYLTWLQKNAALKEFWSQKEAELDALIELAKERGPVKRKRHVTCGPGTRHRVRQDPRSSHAQTR